MSRKGGPTEDTTQDRAAVHVQPASGKGCPCGWLPIRFVPGRSYLQPPPTCSCSALPRGVSATGMSLSSERTHRALLSASAAHSPRNSQRAQLPEVVLRECSSGPGVWERLESPIRWRVSGRTALCVQGCAECPDQRLRAGEQDLGAQGRYL